MRGSASMRDAHKAVSSGVGACGPDGASGCDASKGKPCSVANVSARAQSALGGTHTGKHHK